MSAKLVEKADALAEVDRPAIVGIGEAEAPEIIAAIKIGNAGGRDFEEDLSERIYGAGRGEAGVEFVEIGDEFLVGARIEDAGDELLELIFVLEIGVEPGTGLFGFADGLDHEGAHAFGEAGESILELRM